MRKNISSGKKGWEDWLAEVKKGWKKRSMQPGRRRWKTAREPGVFCLNI
jgi:hypothetical protein